MAHTPNPRRVEAGRRNCAKRKGLTPEGRERLRQLALQHKPWRFSTGPRTAQGKARVSQNGKFRQQGPLSIAAIRAELAEYRRMMSEMREARGMVPQLRPHGR